jgi:Domain of unknown function (DUF4194)
MDEPLLPYAAVILKLLRGVVYADDNTWETLLTYQPAVRQYAAGIGLVVHVDETDGYAYLSQPEAGDDETAAGNAGAATLPRLVRRMPLNYEATLLCVVLRDELLKFEMREPDLARLVLSKAQLQDAMLLFFAERADMTRLSGRIDRAINQVVRAGFLRPVQASPPGEDLYEVKRILKAKISADTLVDIRDKLRQYAETRSAV